MNQRTIRKQVEGCRGKLAPVRGTVQAFQNTKHNPPESKQSHGEGDHLAEIASKQQNRRFWGWIPALLGATGIGIASFSLAGCNFELKLEKVSIKSTAHVTHTNLVTLPGATTNLARLDNR